MTGTCSLKAKLWISSIVVILIISALTGIAYTTQKDTISENLRMGLESTAAVMATQINASDLAGLQPGDEGTPQYLAVAQKLKTMRSMDDQIVNAYILKVNPDGTVTFLVDDLYPDDPAGSAKIGEVSTAPDKVQIIHALSVPTSSNEPYTTKYGSFISAYAPIDDSETSSMGNTAAVLAIDVTAKNYTDYMAGKGNLILLLGLVSIVLAVGAIAVLGARIRRLDPACAPGKK